MRNIAFLPVVLGFVSLPAGAGFITIDNFETVQTVEVTTGVGLPVSAGDVANPTNTALGVERDIWTTKVAGADGDRIRTRVNPNTNTLLRHSQDSGVRGTSRVTYDGIDGDADAIDYDGLGGLDFGVYSDGYFELGVTFNNVLGPVEIAVYDASDLTGATYAVGTIDVAAGIDDLVSPTIYQLDFSAMSLLGGATQDLFSNIGAITLTVDASAPGQGGRDTDILYLSAYTNTPGVPVPGSLPLVGLGLAGLLARRIRRTRPS
jgi:hypothetical protein